jgi:hypothetical protein
MRRSNLRVTHEIQALHFDLPRYNKTLDKNLSIVWRDGIRVWLRHILLGGIPVETGMAKAALVPLGRFIGAAIVDGRTTAGAPLSITPTRKPYTSKLDGLQSIATGEKKQSFSIQDDKSAPMTFLYSFEWSTEILHWYLSEYYRGKAKAGEELIAEADEKFMNHVQQRLQERLPKLADYLTLRKPF